ncbi:hypothetical protein KIW84_058079 [Lathyrus oleraceus]|uniref:Uncharacterized protein n=1 Tax=Pisum sativum TaxID=3888 RepID=A0A9D5ANK2_PEA|nr:hypothetical protein KIW84_058079 [Pisum sativum]
MPRKNKRFYGKINGFRWSSSKDNTDDQKNYFNRKKLGHFRVDCSNLLKERSNKEGFQNDIFRNKLKTSLMTTWDELNNKDESNEHEGEVNLDLMTMTPSDTEYESTLDLDLDEEDEVNAFMQDLNLESSILSVVFDVPITITPTTIANAINYEDEGVVLDMLFWESYLSPCLIFDDLSDLSKVSSLNLKALVWYHWLISNFLPKNKNQISLDIIEQAFMLLLNSYLKINLPRVMFTYLNMTLTFFKEGKSWFTPYGRVLSELFT